MTLVVPAILGGLAITVMALVSVAAARRARMRPVAGSAAAAVRILVHSINDDRCTGCDACVAVCPTNVLDLVENKSRVLRFQDCIQCEACMWACPTTALVMHPEGTEPPTYRMPDLDEFYQTRVPGQYLIGEVAGKPLVKNAANLGRSVIEHMLATGLRSVGQRSGAVDVAIVGSGPGGLSAALTCMQRGLTYVLLEKDSLVASTIARYPKGKLIMAEPYDVANLSLLPVFDSSKEETIPIWKELVERVGIQIRMNETVEQVQPNGAGMFDIRTNVAAYRAQRVVLATGLRGKPRTLGVQGENLPKVASLLEDPDNHRGQTVCVVGGGDSALEAAIALADAGAKVILTYRGKSFSRAQPKNRQTVESYEAQRRIKIKYQSEVVAFAEDTVTLQMADGTQKRYPNQAAFVLIGADPPIDWLGTMGIHYVERQHLFALPPSDQLVARFLGDHAMPCPETAAGAAALVFGEEVPAGAQKRQVVAESRSRKWLRSASKVFTGSGKLERPMPLSEFAQQARKHSGHGRRDKLDPRERTRVLRMLRDEGGRQADEDSKIYVLDKGGRMTGDSAPVGRHDSERRPYGSPPPAPRRGPPPPARPSMPSQVATQPEAPMFDDPVRTIPPTGRERVLGGASLGHSDSSPKAAVIVGLARATERGPRTGPRRRQSPPPSPRPSVRQPIVEAPTRQIGADQSRRLFERLEADRAAEAAEARRRTPPPPAHDPTVDDRFQDDGPTRQVHLGSYDDLALGSEPSNFRPRPPLVPPRGAQGQRHQEDPTRSVNLDRGISEVDWDLD